MRSWSAILDNLFFSLPIIWRVVIIFIVLGLMVIVARKKKFLTPSGTIGAVVVGLIVFYIGGISGFVLLLFFFLSSSIITKLTKNEAGDRKGRSIMQVIANGLPCCIALILYRLSPYPDAFLVAFAASIAEAEADTLSGEIGRLSHKDPVSIITFTRLPKGISGGVTVLGLSAGVLSSFLIALLFAGTFGSTLQAFLTIAASGFLGSVFDSFLGATLQVQYRTKDGRLTEDEYDGEERNERARGIRWIDNDMVNLLSGLFSFSIASVLALL